MFQVNASLVVSLIQCTDPTRPTHARRTNIMSDADSSAPESKPPAAAADEGKPPAEVDEDDEMLCRYCFEGTEAGPLISPCDCRGDQMYVHLSCLRRWQRTVLVSQPTCRARSRSHDLWVVPHAFAAADPEVVRSHAPATCTW